MDWSKHYPQFFHHQQQNQNTKYVEFADIGCGYGGLLGKKDEDNDTHTHSLSLSLLSSTLNDWTVFWSFVCLIQLHCQHFSQTNLSWDSKFVPKLLSMFKNEFRNCVSKILDNIKTFLSFTQMQWNIFHIISKRVRYIFKSQKTSIFVMILSLTILCIFFQAFKTFLSFSGSTFQKKKYKAKNYQVHSHVVTFFLVVFNNLIDDCLCLCLMVSF